MSRVSAALPRKNLLEHERKFLKIAGTHLAEEKGGAIAMADLLDIVASWHAMRADIEFGDYCKRWVLEGNPRTVTSDKLLRNLLGLDQPPPRRIRRAA
jgi:hypothetical protein